jgi:uncharacterized cupredoxin-like copper-binding protein
MKTRRTVALGIGLLAIVPITAACGGDDHHSTTAAAGSRIVDVSMTDMAFSPPAFTANAGETVTFRFRNDGKVVHEAIIGDADYQADHRAAMMSGASGMSDGHGMDHGDTGAGSTVTVKPGKTGELTYRFDQAGTMFIGCHQPGHYEAGMQATVAVS